MKIMMKSSNGMCYKKFRTVKMKIKYKNKLKKLIKFQILINKKYKNQINNWEFWEKIKGGRRTTREISYDSK